MRTHCNQKTLEFQTENSRKIVAHFNSGNISSDSADLLLEHTVEELIAQRTFAVALGYEDLNDHDELRNDPLLAVMVGKEDPTGNKRIRQRDKGKNLISRRGNILSAYCK